MIAIGADVHKRMCTLAVQRDDGQLKMLPSMENTRENWMGLLAKFPPEAEIALEVSTSGHFVMSVLEEGGWRERAHWVHTAGIDSLEKQKYDRLDAKRLDGGRAGAVPQSPAQSVADVWTASGGESFHRAGAGLAERAEPAGGGLGVRRADVAGARFLEHGGGQQRGESYRLVGELSPDRAAGDDSRPRAYSGGGDLERDRRPGALRLGRRSGELHRAGAEPVRERRGFGSRRDHPSRAGLVALGADHGGQCGHTE